MSTKPILISGAGIGGTLLARSLKANNISFHLFERDSDRYARAQGYRIRVSTEGINALKEVLSQEQFDKFHSGTASTGGGGMHQLNAITGEEEESLGPLGSGGPPGPKLGGDVLGVARGWLRECLLDGLDEVVHWGKQAKRYNLTDSGVTLQFADGTTSPEGSLVVIADGPIQECRIERVRIRFSPHTNSVRVTATKGAFDSGRIRFTHDITECAQIFV